MTSIRNRNTVWMSLLFLCCSAPSTQDGESPPGAQHRQGNGVSHSEHTSECATWEREFQEEKRKINRCTRDSDCTEVGPFRCPEGYVYIDRARDPSRLGQLDRQIEASCAVRDCEELSPKGIAQCHEGVCVPGREPPVETPMMSCWDTRYTWLENGQRVSTHTEHQLRGVTPILGMGLPENGTLTLEVDWAPGCTDCTLQISEHNSGMSRLVEGERTRTGRKSKITLPVTKGLYYFLGRSPQARSLPFLLLPRFESEAGVAPASTRHGVNWQRLCEG